MRLTRGLGWSLVAWLAVGLFWFVVTRIAHPTLGLAIITTASLVTACAIASYVNQLGLVPRFWDEGRYSSYAALLLAVLALLTGVALAVIRTAYFRALGPDPDPNGLYKHYAIDFIGVSAHVALAALVVRVTHRFTKDVARVESS